LLVLGVGGCSRRRNSIKFVEEYEGWLVTPGTLKDISQGLLSRADVWVQQFRPRNYFQMSVTFACNRAGEQSLASSGRAREYYTTGFRRHAYHFEQTRVFHGEFYEIAQSSNGLALSAHIGVCGSSDYARLDW